MAQVEIISEREGHAGWMFDAQVLDDGGAMASHHVTLSWADYNLWSPDGADEPARVVEAVLLFLMRRGCATELPHKLDASIARRLHADADILIPTLIQR